MTIAQAYASGSETPLDMIEITHSGLTGGVVRLCSGYRDITATLEDSTEVTFTAIGANIKLENRSTEGAQTLQFGLDNTNRYASDRLKEVIVASRSTREIATLKYRAYLPSSLSAPAAGPYLAQVKASQRDRSKVIISAAFFQIGNLECPSERYNTTIFPLIRYI